jgi:hypothetical protein
MLKCKGEDNIAPTRQQPGAAGTGNNQHPAIFTLQERDLLIGLMRKHVVAVVLQLALLHGRYFPGWRKQRFTEGKVQVDRPC